MTLLQFMIVVACTIFALFAWDAYQRKKITLLHSVIFVGGTLFLLVFGLNTVWLNNFGQLFGVARGADLIVYISIVFLAYLYFDLLNKSTRDHAQFTSLVSQYAIDRCEGSRDAAYDGQPIFVVPTYNESPDVVDAAIRPVLEAGYRVLMIDDGTIDHVAQTCTVATESGLVLLRHSINMGKGAALQTAMRYLRKCELADDVVIVTFDADGQHSLVDARAMVEYLTTHTDVDIVLGSRFLGNTVDMPLMRRVILRAGIQFTKIMSGVRVTDTHNGLRSFRMRLLPQFRLLSNRMSYASEIYDLIRMHKRSYVELPVTIVYTDYSLAKGQKTSNFVHIGFERIYKKFFYR